MKPIYVVMGHTGEYSDRREWPVCGYKTKEMAEEHAFQATKRAKEIFDLIESPENKNRPYEEGTGKGRLGFYDLANDETVPETYNKYDSNMSMDYTGTDYYVIDVEMRSALP